MKFKLALKLNKIVHELCQNVPHDIGIKLVNEIHNEEWTCTKCAWNGKINKTIPVMYKGIDWRHCPSCQNIVIPTSGE